MSKQSYTFWNKSLNKIIIVQKDEKFLSFEMTIMNTGYLVDSSVKPMQKRVRYLFEKKVFDGLVYPQLLKVTECPD